MMVKRIPKWKAGDKAPNIILKDQNGNTIELREFLGKKVIIYFYPKDHTSGCTLQSCDLRDHYAGLKQEGYEVLGISADDVDTHMNFATEYQLPFRLLADTEMNAVKTYDVYGEKEVYGKKYMGIHRTTFIVDENGILEDVITDINTKEHSEQILSRKTKK